jgi:hypothetical protein
LARIETFVVDPRGGSCIFDGRESGRMLTSRIRA